MAQWNKNEQDYLNQERSLFEVYNIADHWGNQTDWRPQFSDNNRLKVAPFQTVFFNTFQYGKETDVWEERVTGVATANHNVNSSNVVMQVGSTAGLPGMYLITFFVCLTTLLPAVEPTSITTLLELAL